MMTPPKYETKEDKQTRLAKKNAAARAKRLSETELRRSARLEARKQSDSKRISNESSEETAARKLKHASCERQRIANLTNQEATLHRQNHARHEQERIMRLTDTEKTSRRQVRASQKRRRTFKTNGNITELPEPKRPRQERLKITKPNGNKATMRQKEHKQPQGRKRTTGNFITAAPHRNLRAQQKLWRTQKVNILHKEKTRKIRRRTVKGGQETSRRHLNKIYKQKSRKQVVSSQRLTLKETAELLLQNEDVVQIHTCQNLTNRCVYCGAYYFENEKTKQGKFTLCCRNGLVKLPEISYAKYLENLLKNKDEHSKIFREHIRSLNSSFAFASMGANISPPPGYGPYCFRIHGQIYHRTGTLHPVDNEGPKFSQLYILDEPVATNARLALPGNTDCPEILVSKISALLDEINPHVFAYKMLYEVEKEAIIEAEENGTQIPQIVMAIKQDRNQDPRRYNKPRVSEVAVVFENADGAPPSNRDLLIHLIPNEANQFKRVKQINILHRDLDALVYPLLYPWGEQGWGPYLTHDFKQMDENHKGQQLSPKKYYCYRFQIRDTFNPTLNAGRLTQQYVVDAYVKMESNNLNYIHKRQDLFTETKKGLEDFINFQTDDKVQPGKIKILPSSFEGSPRNMQQRYYDAMAIVTKFGKPDYFLTVTCNPKWKEISDNLNPWDKAEDRPDLVARVFNLKLKSLLEDIQNYNLLGEIVASVHVIEFQKRGLPHAHILFIVDKMSKLNTAEAIDKVICAEIPDKDKFPKLFDIVTTLMVHGPCGNANPKAPCMVNGKCSKGFPKEFRSETIVNEDGYPKYRRREFQPVRVGKRDITNAWVVPYNRLILLKYNWHANLEFCGSITSVKYLFKYVYKGYDCANLEITEENKHDETKRFVDSRYVSAPEAMWRIFGFCMHKQSHTIVRLDVHLLNEQSIVFEKNKVQEALNRADKTKTRLMAWFDLNGKDESARRYFYREIPEHYVYNSRKGWLPRQRGENKVIGRIYAVNPKDQERYFLRMLLLNIKGATSFEDLKTVNGEYCESFRESAKKRGLLLDEEIWTATIEDAVVFATPQQLRSIFAFMCCFAILSEPSTIWNTYKEHFMLDYCYKFHKDEFSNDCTCCELHALKALQEILDQHGIQCCHLGLPQPPENFQAVSTRYDSNVEWDSAWKMIDTLNNEQKHAFNEIEAAINDTSIGKKCFFLDGPGGSGKTYLYKTLLHYIRGQSKTVFPAASTGIAANLLEGGRTFHSLFKVPVPVNETSVSSIKPSSIEGIELREASLIIIDECTMASSHQINVIDTLLQQVMNCRKPFGGKVMVFGGDFRQCLAIIPHGLQAAIVQNSLKYAKSWPFKTLSLGTNMRSDDPEYSEWLLKLGNGTLKNEFDLEDSIIEIPSAMICKEDFIQSIFGSIISLSVINEISKRAILCPKNTDVEKLNEQVMNILEGNYVEYLSDDKVETEDDNERLNFPLEFLHTVTPSGMPSHCLKLKIGTIIMLLRNLNTRRGLCNGTRLVVTALEKHVIKAEVLTGSAEGEEILIPRIDLCPSETGLPFKLKRRQFPVKPAFAMTINKSQGQTLERVGIYLPEPVFGHGQLYVAFSRVRRSADVKVMIIDGPQQGKLIKGCDSVFTKNVVFREVFKN